MNVYIYSCWFTLDHTNSLFIHFSIFKITFSLDELINSGMSPKYKKSFRPSDFEGDSLFVRKFVVPQGGKVSNIQGLGLSNINDRIEL